MKFSEVIVFGGSGFIGLNFAEHILLNELSRKVYLVDFNEPELSKVPTVVNEALEAGNVSFISCDVREEISLQGDFSRVELIANFAAVHREPGHEPFEYFETNIRGAENVCRWAEKISCNTLVFSSSIAPYGPSERKVNENSIPVPETPYGSSKLVAEKIHISWQNREFKQRKLVIVRPGVVFGAGEGGNVSRMIKAVLGRYFFFVGNENTIKAGIYVKELCQATTWVLDNQDNFGEKVSLFNATMHPAPTLREYTDTITRVSGVKRGIPRIPYSVLYLASIFIDFFSNILRVNQPINPTRVRKLVRSNNIEAQYLQQKGYSYKYSLEDALADWKQLDRHIWKF